MAARQTGSRATAERTDCCVVGGGPAGMVLALLLARAGIDVMVLEKHADFLRDFRGDTVHASTLTLLDELGLGERFARLPQSTVGGVRFPIAGGTQVEVADFSHVPGRYQHVAIVPQWDLLELLASAAEREPHFTLRRETEVTGVLRDGSRVTGVRYRHPDGTAGQLHTGLAVGCDGRWSLLRREAGLVPHEYRVPFDAWWLRLPRHDGDALPPLSARIQHAQIVVVIGREDYYQLAYLPRKGSDALLREQGVKAFRQRLAGLLPELADRVGTIRSMDDVQLLDVRLNRLPRWYVDGLLCIGDAAHAMSPIGGVGINLAVQDAVAAARLLAGPLRRSRVRTTDLARVQARRFLPTMLIQGVQRILHAGVIEPVLTGRRSGLPPFPLTLLSRYPALRAVPGYLIAIGPLPEHAPAFARRPPAP